MTEAEREAIRARDAESGATWFTGPASFTAQGARDRRALLAEVDRLIFLVRQRAGELVMALNPELDDEGICKRCGQCVEAHVVADHYTCPPLTVGTSK